MATTAAKRRRPSLSGLTSARLRFGRLGSVWTDWWMWSFLPLGLLYLVLVLTHISNIIVNVYGDADANSPLVVAELFADRSVGNVVTSNFPWYSTLLFAEATKWLPAHRLIWELGPYILGLLSIALMAWAALRVAGRWAATLTAVILLCGGPDILELMFWLTNHTPTWYSLALLAAFLVLITERKLSIGWLPLAILTLFVGVIVGINLATDKELLVSGLFPLLLASIVTWILCRTALAAKAMWFALAVATVIGVSAMLTTSIMHSAGVVSTGYRVQFVSIEALSTNVKSWWQSIALLGNGAFLGETITFTAVVKLICAVSSVGVVLLIPRYTWRYIGGRRSGGEPMGEQLSVYMTFWTASIVCLSAGYIFSSAPIFPTTAESTHYLVGIVYAVAAMLPLLARSSLAMRAGVVAGALMFLLSAVIALDRSSTINAPVPAIGPSPQVAQAVSRTAEEMHATYGYGLYWDASTITWRAHFKVLVAPIVGCNVSATKLCPGPRDDLEAWYFPVPRSRTFLLTDSEILPWAPPATLGQAIVTRHFGTVTMYVYDYNIVERLLSFTRIH